MRALAAGFLAPPKKIRSAASPLGILLGFATFTLAGFALGAFYGIVWEFWSKKLR
jgi:hypothetical protein